jgi:GT2 family glycosyltransferase
MISIVTGTLNRKYLLPYLIENTVESNSKLELVLVDGGSTDGSIEYIKSLNNDQIKLIEYGKRSSYPHFMNLGIKNSKYDYICQWNDDVLLCNNWNDIINEIDDSDVYLFNWKYGHLNDANNKNWLNGNNHLNGWCLLNNKCNNDGSVVMNYGIYKKDVFRKIGLYNNDYKYYYADSDMSERSYYFNMKIKTLRNIKVLSINTNKRAEHYSEDEKIFVKNLELYKRKELSKNIEILK